MRDMRDQGWGLFFCQKKRSDKMHGHTEKARECVGSQVRRIKALLMEIKAGTSITVGTKALSETIPHK